MVSWLALTAAPVETAPRPVLAMALVDALCPGLLRRPLDAAAVDPEPPTTVPVPLPMPVPAMMPLPPLAPAAPPAPAVVNELVDCVPLAGPPEVLMYISSSIAGLCQ